MTDIPIRIVLPDGTSHCTQIDAKDLMAAEFALYNDVHDKLAKKQDMIVSVVCYYKDVFGVEKEYRSMGIRVAKGIFVTCAHSVSEKITETSDPILEHFRRERVYVEGKLANVLVSGSVAVWNEDIALLQAQDDWMEMDLGSVASVRRGVLDRYRSLFSVQSFGPEFILSRHRLQGYIQHGLGVTEIYGDPGMSGSPILDAEGEVVGMLRGCIGERMLRITFITGEMMHVAATHAKVENKINWI